MRLILRTFWDAPAPRNPQEHAVVGAWESSPAETG